jgi:hypothetical protein
MLEDYELASATKAAAGERAAEIHAFRDTISHIAGFGPRTVEQHEQSEARLGSHRERLAAGSSLSPTVQRAVALLAEALQDYAELYAVWESSCLANDRNPIGLRHHDACRCRRREALVAIPELGLWIKKHPVTVEEFAECCEYYRSPWPNLDDRIPATGVNWREAYFYSVRHGGRLPTLTEWAVAAGAPDRLFPWGRSAISGACNSAEEGIGHPTPVDKFDTVGASPYGICDLMGNAGESQLLPFQRFVSPCWKLTSMRWRIPSSLAGASTHRFEHGGDPSCSRDCSSPSTQRHSLGRTLSRG